MRIFVLANAYIRLGELLYRRWRMPVRAFADSCTGVGGFLHQRLRIPAPAFADSCTGVGRCLHWRMRYAPMNNRLPLSPVNHLLQPIPIARDGTNGIDELDIVTGGVIAPTLELAVFVHLFHHLIVVFDNQVFG